MGTVGNLNIKAAVVIDSRLLIFQAGPTLLHHRQNSCCVTKKKREKKRQRHVGEVGLVPLERHLQPVAQGREEVEKQEENRDGVMGGVEVGGRRTVSDQTGSRRLKSTPNSDNCTDSRWSHRNLSDPNQRLRPGGTNSGQARNDVALVLTN